MKNKISLMSYLCLLFILIFFSLSLASTVLSTEMRVKVKVEKAKIRFEPSSESEVLSNVKNGEILEAEEKLGDWYKVTFTLKESGFTLSGYIHESNIEIVGQELKNQSDYKENTSYGIESIAPRSLRYRESGNFICTTNDLRYEYEIIGVLTHYQEFGALSLRDPLVGAIDSGMKKFKEKAIKMGGDAVVGLRYEFENRTQKDEGRLLIYGTVIRFK
ncbi:MAG: SH3 domain-containing protein [Promethearchaeota archaeon]